MKAVVRDPSRPSGVRLVELGDPGLPGPGQVRVRMLMAPVNPADRMFVAGSYAATGALPDIAGAEGVGILEQVGERVAGMEAGERVILMSRGNWVGVRLVSAGEVMPLPVDLADVQAAMLRINPATAYRLLDWLGLSRGALLIQNAAGSSVGRWVRLLASRRGVRTLNIVRRGGLDAGADPVLLDGDDLARRVVEATDGAPVAAALDAVAGDATGRLAECLSPGRELLVFGHLSKRPCSIPSTLMTSRGLRLRGFSLRPAEAGEPRERTRKVYATLAAILAESPEPVAAVYPLDQVERALEACATPGRGGRVLLAASPTRNAPSPDGNALT